MNTLTNSWEKSRNLHYPEAEEKKTSRQHKIMELMDKSEEFNRCVELKIDE